MIRHPNYENIKKRSFDSQTNVKEFADPSENDKKKRYSNDEGKEKNSHPNYKGYWCALETAIEYIRY